jgi:hypothetical protein
VVRDRMVATGRISNDQIDAHLARLRNPTVGHLSFETWYAWGRRPVATKIHVEVGIRFDPVGETCCATTELVAAGEYATAGRTS